MQIKNGLMALGVIATLVLVGGNTAEAKSDSTDKKETKKVVVTVKPGDTLTAIAQKHHTSYVRLFNANTSIDNPDLIYAGDKFRIPKKDEKLKNRLAQLSASQQLVVTSSAAYQQTAAAASTTTTTPRGSSAGNTYAWGTCTWYAKEMRPDLPNQLGNGGQWVSSAAAQGIPTGTTPKVGAIAEEPGHVAYVEAVKGSMITISEMNYGGGVGQVHRRTVPAANYRYIY